MRPTSKTTLFLLITFFVNGIMAGAFYFSGGDYQTSGTWLALVYMFVPMLVVIILEKAVYKNPIRSTYNISFKFNKWFLIAWFLPPLIAFLTFGISLLFPGVAYSPEMEGIMDRFKDSLSPEEMEKMKNTIDQLPFHPVWLSLIQGLIAGATINAIAGFGEELGWRGFLIRSFKQCSFWKTSAIIGFIWGLWHAPLILLGHNYPDHPFIGIVMMIIFCLLCSPLFLYITIKSKSVIAASVFHGTINGTQGLAIILINGGSNLLTGITGLSGFIALLLFITIFYSYDRWVSDEQLMNNKPGEFI